MSFWGELKRRNVYKVGVAYAIVAWLIIQAVSITFPVLHLPGWAVTLVTVLVIIGFPFALLFAWAFEVTPEGIKRTKEVPLAESITHLTGQKLNYIVTGLLVIAVGLLAVKVFFIEKRTVETEVVSTETEQAPAVIDVEQAPKTIAVLPFENLSSDPEQVYFVDGLSEELLNSLTKIPDLLVTARTSSFSFKGTNKKVQEIANELGVENILEGSVRKAGNELRISAQLIRASDGFHLWSKTYDRELKDIFAVQEDIATAVADELKASLGIGKSFKQLGGTDNVEAYELYLIAIGQITNNEIRRSLETTEAALALDPKFVLAWALKANVHGGLSMEIPYGLVPAELDAGLYAAQRAIELEPNLAEANIALGHTKTVRHEWVDAELIYRKAIELTTKQTSEDFDPDTITVLWMHYWAVGNLKKALELAYQVRLKDPLKKIGRAEYIQILGINGDMREAEKEDERCRALFGDEWNSYNYAITYLRLGVDDSVSSDEITWYGLVSDVAKKNFDSPEKGLLELRRLYTDDTNLSSVIFHDISIWAAYFGDPEFAMDAMEKAVSFQGVNAFALWLPVMHEVRQTSRFKEYIKKIGLVDYWNQFGWPDLCRPLDNGDFECD